ncbi:MAG: ribosome maturation factor RimP [Rickettsiaceae bacterium]|nr:ribosome maturation factor RimP [Rickettsiaceae bacterium]
MEEKITQLIEASLNDLGFDLVRVLVNGSSIKTVEIILDRQDGGKISLNDCKIASNNISAILDVEDVIEGKYFLEVSSAGAERPLVKLNDYQKFAEREGKIRLKQSMNEKLSFRGRLKGIQGDEIYMEINNEILKFPFANIKSGKLVMSDDMFKELLNKKK